MTVALNLKNMIGLNLKNMTFRFEFQKYDCCV